MKIALFAWQHSKLALPGRSALKSTGFEDDHIEEITALDNVVVALRQYPTIRYWLFDVKGEQAEYSLLEKVKADHPDCYIVCLTQTDAIADACVQCGADDCVTVDVPPEQWKKKVFDALYKKIKSIIKKK